MGIRVLTKTEIVRIKFWENDRFLQLPSSDIGHPARLAKKIRLLASLRIIILTLYKLSKTFDKQAGPITSQLKNRSCNSQPSYF